MRYRFSDCGLDTERYELVRAGELVTVQPKVFDVLQYLIEHRDRVVSKDELLDALWRDQAVEEGSVPWTIGRARRAIGQQKRDKQPIQTVHGRGYLWCAPVEVAKEVASTRPVDGPFVGRALLLSALESRLRDAKAGRGGICVLVGDAGIGKTRCLDEVSALAQGLGFVARSACCAPDTLAPVYHPWLQLLGDEDDGRAREQQRHRLEGHSGAGGDMAGPLAFFEHVAKSLTRAGTNTPTLLVVDDLHWADAGSLELLAFVAAPLRKARVLVLAASREPLSALDIHHAAELSRAAERFDVEPLGAADVALVVSAQLGHATVPAALSDAVLRVSGGYPLFVRETMQRLLTQHEAAALLHLPADAIPPSLHARELLAERLRTLAPETRSVLAAASVLGSDCDMSILMRLIGISHEGLCAALGEATASRFLERDMLHGARFRHALFREAVYEQIPLSERARLHRAAALMLAGSPDAAAHASEIAHHHHRARSLGHHTEVREAAVAAAQAAARALAFTDAARFCGFALDALALEPGADPRTYAQLLLLKARMQRYAGSVIDARRTLEKLVEVASAHAFGDLLVHAARAVRLTHAMGFLPDPLARTALERALEVLPASAHNLRLCAESLLSWLPPEAWDIARSKSRSADVLARARASGERATLIEALAARLYALTGPDDIDAQLAVCHELLAIDDGPRGLTSIEAFAARRRALALRGDLDGTAEANAAMREVGERRGYLEVCWHADRSAAEAAFLHGDFDRADAELARLEDDAARMRVQTGERIIGVVRALLAMTRDGPGALSDPVAAMLLGSLDRPGHDGHVNQTATVARLALMRGRGDVARRTLRALARDDFSRVPRDSLFAHTLGSLGLVAVGVGDRAVAGQVFDQLTPYATCGTPQLLGLHEGPVAGFLARIAAYLGDDLAAESHFYAAITTLERLELRPLLALTHSAHAHWLRGTDRQLEAEMAETRTIELANELGMEWLAKCHPVSPGGCRVAQEMHGTRTRLKESS